MCPQLRNILGLEQIWKSRIKYYGFPEFVWKHFYPTKDGNLSLNTMEFHISRGHNIMRKYGKSY